MSRWVHETLLPAQPGSARRARSFVSHHLADHRLFVLLDPVRLIASELATNAIVHAGTEFTVTLTGLTEKVVLSVEDEIEDPVIPRPAVSGSQEFVPTGVGGRGLLIVGMLSEEWGVTSERPGFKTVWASFHTHGI